MRWKPIVIRCSQCDVLLHRGPVRLLAPRRRANIGCAGETDASAVDLRQDLGRVHRVVPRRFESVVQRVLLSGRFHYEYANLNADQGDHAEWNVRRWRIGPRITLFRTLTLHGEVELDPQRHDPFYVRFTDLYVQWTKSPAARAHDRQAGRPVHPGWRNILERAPDHRSQQPRQQHLVSAGVHSGRERLRAGAHRGSIELALYSAGEANRELGEFSGGAVVLGVLGYDFAAVARSPRGAADRQLRLSASGSR